MELEITQILKHVENSIKEIACVEGEIARVIKTGNRVSIKFKSGNSYDLGLLNKNTTQAVLDNEFIETKYELPSDGVRGV